MKFIPVFLMTLMSVALFTACNDDDDEASIIVELTQKVGNEDLEPGKVYAINGVAVQFDLVSFYAGGFDLGPATPQQITDKYLLVNAEENRYLLGNIEAGKYDKIGFFVGVDPVTNSLSEDDFTSRPADDPLSVQFPSMHWGWNSGYRFMRVDGQVDTDQDGIPETLMAFHIGTDAFLRTLEFQFPYDLLEGENLLRVEFDVAKMFDGIDLRTDHETHTGDNIQLANQFIANLPNAFSAAQ